MTSLWIKLNEKVGWEERCAYKYRMQTADTMYVCPRCTAKTEVVRALCEEGEERQPKRVVKQQIHIRDHLVPTHADFCYCGDDSCDMARLAPRLKFPRNKIDNHLWRWEYTVNGGIDWNVGCESSFEIDEGIYPANAIRIRVQKVKNEGRSARVWEIYATAIVNNTYSLRVENEILEPIKTDSVFTTEFDTISHEEMMILYKGKWKEKSPCSRCLWTIDEIIQSLRLEEEGGGEKTHLTDMQMRMLKKLHFREDKGIDMNMWFGKT